MPYIKALYKFWLTGQLSDKEYIRLTRDFLFNKFDMSLADKFTKVTKLYD